VVGGAGGGGGGGTVVLGGAGDWAGGEDVTLRSSSFLMSMRMMPIWFLPLHLSMFVASGLFIPLPMPHMESLGAASARVLG
jgi:hypothetical protein